MGRFRDRWGITLTGPSAHPIFELWLAPVEGAKLLLPFRVSVHNMLGNFVMQATQFEMPAQTAAK